MKIKSTICCSFMKDRLVHHIMKTFIFLLCTTVFSFNTENSFSQEMVTIEKDELVKANRVFKIIQKQTNFDFIYPSGLFKNKPKILLKKGEILAEDLLQICLKQSNLNFEILDGGSIIIKEKSQNIVLSQQEYEVSGKITDQAGQPLPGASIIEKGTNNGTQSDFDGNFSIKVTNENTVLVISYLGFNTQEIVVAGQSTIQIILKEDVANLDEVVVVGFGTQSSRKVVSSISNTTGEDLGVSTRPVTNLQASLIGSMPGLRGFNPNGRPGVAPSFRIRGNSTLGSSSILVIIDGFEGSLTDLNPQNIDKVSILKDAAAVAVYGARGANGVMLVSTKSGKRNQKMSVSYNYNVAVQQPSDLPGTLSALELIEFENFAVTGDPTGGGNPGAPYSPAVRDLALSGFYPETVWPDELYKSSADQQSHSLTVQGGGKKASYLMNANYLTQNGLVVGPDNFKRLGLRLKLDADINDWLTVGSNVLISNRVTKTTPATGGDGLLGSPFFPVKTVDGIFVDKGSSGNPNPIAQALSGSFYKTAVDAANIQAYIKINPLKGLTIEERVSLVKSNVNARSFTNVFDIVSLDLEDPDSYTNPDSPNRGYSIGSMDARRLLLTSRTSYSIKSLTTAKYNRKFGAHNFGALLGFQSEQGESESFQAARTGFLLDNILSLNLGEQNDPNIGNGLGNSASFGGNATTLSYFGRLNYDYKGRYLVEAVFRYDGSSSFLDSNQWGFFPAVALGWNIAEEGFMSKANFVDKLKLSTSYGETGDDASLRGRTIQLVNLDVTGYPIGGEIQPRLWLGSPVNPDLKWETARTFNVGLDFSLWQGKLQLKSEYFNTNRFDILSAITTPTEYGFGNVPANLYAVNSWGWEFEFSHQNNIGDVNYWFNANLTSYDNEITNLDGREFPNFAVGQSINDRFGFVTDGFFDNQAEIDAHLQGDGTTPINQSNVGGTRIGGYKYVDQLTVDTNNDGIPDAGDGLINGDDKVILDRNSATNLNIGGTLGMSYKGLTLSTRFYGALDRKQWWSGAGAHEPFLNGTNAFDYQLNYWRPDNPNAFFPTPVGNGIQGYDSNVSHLIYDNEFIKIQNITLSYDFGQSILDKLNAFEALNISLSMENVGTVWTNSPTRPNGWDPELSVGYVEYPLPFTTSISVNVKF